MPPPISYRWLFGAATQPRTPPAAPVNIDNKAIVNSTLRPRCALPPPPFFGRLCIFNRKENPFLAIGDAAYRKHAEGGPSHGHRQHAQKIGKNRACGSGDILADRHTYIHTDRHTVRQTDPQTDILITMLTQILPCWFSLTISRSSAKVKVIGQSSRLGLGLCDLPGDRRAKSGKEADPHLKLQTTRPIS